MLIPQKCLPSPGSNVCVRCSKLQYSQSPLPCLYFRIIDIVLFRTMTDPISQKPYRDLMIHRNISEPVQFLEPNGTNPNDSRPVAISITQDNGTELHLEVGHSDQSKIPDGVSDPHRALYAHPYALADIDGARDAIRGFVNESVGPYINAKIPETDLVSRLFFAKALQCVQSKRVCFV